MDKLKTKKIALYIDDENECVLTPAETIAEMFDYTDASGTLYIPAWPDDWNESMGFYKCEMDWNKADADKLIAEHISLTADIAGIAKILDPFDPEADAEALPVELRGVWDTYIKHFELGDLDQERISAIIDAMEDDTASTIPAEDLVLYDQYCEALNADAERRLSRRLAAYDVIYRARRLCKLMNLGAPQVVINLESDILAQALAISKHCKAMERVDEV